MKAMYFPAATPSHHKAHRWPSLDIEESNDYHRLCLWLSKLAAQCDVYAVVCEEGTKEAMKYRYRLWCNDCAGDPYGCFDGSSTLSETFDTYEQARDAGDSAASTCGPWDYCVTDEEGKEIKEPNEQQSIS